MSLNAHHARCCVACRVRSALKLLAVKGCRAVDLRLTRAYCSYFSINRTRRGRAAAATPATRQDKTAQCRVDAQLKLATGSAECRRGSCQSLLVIEKLIDTGRGGMRAYRGRE